MNGFHETEIGSFPKAWNLARIDDVFSLQQGKSLSAKERTGDFLKPFLRTSNVFWGRLDLSKVDAMDIPPKDRERLALRDGDVLVCEGGDIGRTAIWRGELSECYYQNHLHRLRPKGNDINPLFFIRWMEAAFQTLNLYSGIGNRTTIPNLSSSRLREFLFPLPPLPEQKKIAAVLSKLQRSIEVQERLIQSLRDLKKSAMNHLFTHGLRGEKLKKTEIGMMPQSWVMTTVGDLCSITTGKRDVNEGSPEGEFPFYTCADKISRSDTFSFNAEAILVAGNGIIGNTKYYKGKFEVYQRTYVLTDFTCNALYLYCYLSERLKHDLVRSKSGSTMPYIRKGDLSGFPVPIPPPSEQTEIAHILQTIDRKLKNHESQKASMQALFKTMLNKLMTGQVRVKDLDIDTVEVEVA